MLSMVIVHLSLQPRPLALSVSKKAFSHVNNAKKVKKPHLLSQLELDVATGLALYLANYNTRLGLFLFYLTSPQLNRPETSMGSEWPSWSISREYCAFASNVRSAGGLQEFSYELAPNAGRNIVHLPVHLAQLLLLHVIHVPVHSL